MANAYMALPGHLMVEDVRYEGEVLTVQVPAKGGAMKRIAWYAVLAIALHISGCGGGEDGSNPGSAPPSPTPERKAPEGNFPFGGGLGKIVFAEGMILPKSISELDVATRRVRTLVKLGPPPSFVFVGGVTRANDGTFAVIGHDWTDLSRSSTIYHYELDGTLIRKWEVPRTIIAGGVSMRRPLFTEGGALSPDAKSIALANKSVLADRLEVVILDVPSGNFVIRDLLGPNDSPRDKTNLHASTVWSPAGELYVISEVGLHRVDRATGAGTLMHPVTLFHPRAPIMLPDARTIYFDQDFGNPHGGTIWSMDIASGEITRRSMRSGAGSQYSPTLSPDGEWLLLQEVDYPGGVFVPAPIFAPNPLIGAVAFPFVVSTVRLAEPPHDTQNLQAEIRDAAGKVHSAQGRMVWY